STSTTSLSLLSVFLTGAPPPPASPLSLHDALPIYQPSLQRRALAGLQVLERARHRRLSIGLRRGRHAGHHAQASALERIGGIVRSEEHTSELQSRENLVCRLLLEKQKAGARLVLAT